MARNQTHSGDVFTGALYLTCFGEGMAAAVDLIAVEPPDGLASLRWGLLELRFVFTSLVALRAYLALIIHHEIRPVVALLLTVGTLGVVSGGVVSVGAGPMVPCIIYVLGMLELTILYRLIYARAMAELLPPSLGRRPDRSDRDALILTCRLRIFLITYLCGGFPVVLAAIELNHTAIWFLAAALTGLHAIVVPLAYGLTTGRSQAAISPEPAPSTVRDGVASSGMLSPRSSSEPERDLIIVVSPPSPPPQTVGKK